MGKSLLPNKEYIVNTYKFTTDNLGRITKGEGQLQIKSREKRLSIRDSIEDIGKGYQLEGDQRGHIIADVFNGPNGLENAIPQNQSINQSDYKKIELELLKEIKNGRIVNVTIELLHTGNSFRPKTHVIYYSIDGEENCRIIPNK